MAKKTKFKLDDYGMPSNDLDFDDMDFEFGDHQKKDDRNPVTKVAVAAAKSVGKEMTSPSFLRKMIKESMPTGYGEAMDKTDEIANNVRDLYDTAAKEIKPAIRDLKKVTKRIMPTADSVLPKKIAERIKKWSESDDSDNGDRASLSVESQRESALQMQLGEIFKFQTEAAMQKDSKDEAVDRIRDGINHSRHRDQIGQLDSMRISLQQLANYQNKVDASFQRKSLELQFRHYAVAADTLTEMKRYNAQSSVHMGGILKNTGLPEYAKLHNLERVQDVLRNKFIDKVHNNIADRNSFINKLGTNVIGNLKGKLKDNIDDFREGLSGADQVMDMAQQGSEMGMGTPGEMAGDMAGGVIANTAGGKAAKWLKGKIGKNKTIEKFGNEASYVSNNLPQIVTDWANSTKGDDIPIIGAFLQTVKDEARKLNSVDTKLTNDNSGGMEQPQPTTRGVNKSLTEIIPGYLARIYRELQITNGAIKPELTHYDFTTNKFSEESKVISNIIKDVAGTETLTKEQKEKEVKELEKKAKRNGYLNSTDKERLKFLKSGGTSDSYTKQQADELINQVLKDTGKNLTNEQRSSLGHHILTENLRNNGGTKDRLTNTENYRGDATKFAKEFAELFEAYFANDESSEKKRVFSEKFSNVGSYIKDGRKEVQDHVNTGKAELLEKAGLVSDNGSNINLETIHKLHSGVFDPDKAQHHAKGGKVRKTEHTRRSNKKGDTEPAMLEPGEYVVKRDAAEAIGQVDLDHLNQSRNSGAYDHTGDTKKTGPSSILETIADTLLRIEKRLDSTFNTTGSGSGSSGGKKSFWDKTIGEAVTTSVSATINGIKKTAEVAKNTMAKPLGWGMSALGFGKDLAVKGATAVKDRVMGFRDVWVSGEAKARLDAWKLKAGIYRDAVTGKVITSYKDIKNGVKDEYGNVILKAEEISKSFVKNGIVVKAITALGAVASKVKNIAMSIPGKIGGIYGMGLQGAMWVGRKAVGLLYQAQDIYVKGKPTPALLAMLMEKGSYVSAVTGKTIIHPGMIDGPVLGPLVNGKRKTVLTMEQLSGGLFDSNGKPIRVGLSKLTGWAKDSFNATKALAKKGAKLAGKALSSAIGVGKKMLSGAANVAKYGLSGLVNGQGTGGGMDITPMISLLTSIRDILKARLPKPKKAILGDEDGDGIRENSYADMRRKLRNKAAVPALLGGTGKAGGAAALAGAGTGAGSSDPGWLTGAAGTYAGAKVLGWGKDAFNWTKGKLGFGSKAVTTAAEGAGAITKAAETANAASKVGPITNLATKAGNMVGIGSRFLSSPGAKLAGGVLGKLAVPLAAATSVYDGASDLNDLRTGKKNVGDWDKENQKMGFMKAINPWEVGKWGGSNINNLMNRNAKWWTGDEDATVGGKAFEAMDWSSEKLKSLKRLLTGEEDPDEKLKRLTDDLKLKNALKAKKEKDKIASEENGSVSTVAAPTVSKKPSDIILKADQQATSAVGLDVPGSIITVKGTSADGDNFDVDKLSALQVIRFKAYGLVEMNKAKIDAILKLERLVRPDIKIDKDNVASWSGSNQRVLIKIGTEFGCNGVENNRGYAWLTWFDLRFLPVYLGYLGALKGATGKEDQDAATTVLTAETTVSVAKSVAAIMSKYNGSKIPVWSVPASPWADYAINMDKGSIDLNFKALEEKVKAEVSKEEKAKESPSNLDANANSKDTNKPKPNPAAEKSFFGKIGESISSVAKTTKDYWANTSAGKAVGEVAKTTTDYWGAALGGGTPITHPGNGTGGDINSLPLPNGDGSWKAVKDTILGAAKMVGVDGKLMATMAAIESGFKSTVKAGTSSATGLYQFISSTWKEMIGKYGSKYGIAQGTPPTDPRANALMGAEFIKQNANAIKGSVNRELTDTDLYLAHFLGAGGAKKFLSANPSASAVDLMPKEAKANPGIFTSGGSPRTVGEVYSHLNNLVLTKGKKFGLNEASFQMSDTTATDGNKAASETNSSQSNPSDIGSKGTAPVIAASVTGSKDAPVPATTASTAAPAKPVEAKVVPVSYQSPGVSYNPPSTEVKPVASGAPVTSGKVVPVDPALAAASSGFKAPSNKDINTQVQYKKDEAIAVFGNVSDTLNASLGIHKDQLNVLKQILVLMNNGDIKGKQQNNAETTKQNPSKFNMYEQAKPIPEAPVSVRKPVIM